MIWRCLVCGHQHQGDSPPQHCPICHASRDDFEMIDSSIPSEDGL